MDFVTGHPKSQGNTVILTIVDRFSKSAHFIPLPKLPSSKETAQILDPTRLPSPWDSPRGDLRPGSSIRQRLLEGILHPGRSKTSAVVRIPPADEWPDRETQPRAREVSPSLSGVVSQFMGKRITVDRIFVQ